MVVDKVGVDWHEQHEYDKEDQGTGLTEGYIEDGVIWLHWLVESLFVGPGAFEDLLIVKHPKGVENHENWSKF